MLVLLELFLSRESTWSPVTITECNTGRALSDKDSSESQILACLQAGHVKINIPGPQPPEILRRALGSPQCDSSSSCDNTLRKTASLKSFPHLPGSHREVKEAVGFISEECRLNLIGLKSEAGLRSETPDLSPHEMSSH